MECGWCFAQENVNGDLKNNSCLPTRTCSVKIKRSLGSIPIITMFKSTLLIVQLTDPVLKNWRENEL